MSWASPKKSDMKATYYTPYDVFNQEESFLSAGEVIRDLAFTFASAHNPPQL